MRSVLFLSLCVMTLGANTAWANCKFAGRTYPLGSTVCFDGWLQECTVGGFWKAIGQCKAPLPAEAAQDSDRNALLLARFALPSGESQIQQAALSRPSEAPLSAGP